MLRLHLVSLMYRPPRRLPDRMWIWGSTSARESAGRTATARQNQSILHFHNQGQSYPCKPPTQQPPDCCKKTRAIVPTNPLDRSCDRECGTSLAGRPHPHERYEPHPAPAPWRTDASCDLRRLDRTAGSPARRVRCSGVHRQGGRAGPALPDRAAARRTDVLRPTSPHPRPPKTGGAS